MSTGLDTSPAYAAEELERLVALDRRHLLHPYLPGGHAHRTVWTAGSGSRVWDAAGREYIDATGGLWLAQIGHGRSEIAEVAAAQMRRLEYFPTFWDFTNPQAIELAARLAELAPGSIERVFFTSGGSEGNDAAIKMARLFHTRRGQQDRTWILSRRCGYHGMAYGSGTATGFEFAEYGVGPRLPHVRHLSPAWPYHVELYDGEDPTDYCVRELERTIEELGADRIAAFIGEPIMGVAGMIPPPDDYWPRMQAVLREHEILLVFDEVITAFGRLGEWFAAQHFGVEPDIIVTAKGLSSGYAPIGAVLTSREVGDVLASEYGFLNGYTYTGHPTSCAIALANLDILAAEDLLAAARRTGKLLLEELRTLEELPNVGEARGLGLMAAVELVEDKATRRRLPEPVRPLQDVLLEEHGVIVRDCHDDVGHSLVFSPPLVVSDDEVRQIVEAVRKTLA